ncbi:MAG TPA: hypothetical protein VGJ00_02705 [Rhabdochlamydiaceae bacterium]|jgi:ketosteroid isomerase-like protein
MSNYRKFLEDAFSHYSKGETEKFFHCLDSKVKWSIHGEHDLAGEYNSINEVKKAYQRYTDLLRDKPKHRLRYLVIEGNKAIALLFDEVVGKDNRNYEINYTLYLDLNKAGDRILKVDNFLDSQPIVTLAKVTSGKKHAA